MYRVCGFAQAGQQLVADNGAQHKSRRAIQSLLAPPVVVCLALLWIVEELVGFLNLAETLDTAGGRPCAVLDCRFSLVGLFGGFGLVGTAGDRVGMVTPCQLPVGALDRLLVGVGRDAEDGIIVALRIDLELHGL